MRTTLPAWRAVFERPAQISALVIVFLQAHDHLTPPCQPVMTWKLATLDQELMHHLVQERVVVGQQTLMLARHIDRDGSAPPPGHGSKMQVAFQRAGHW